MRDFDASEIPGVWLRSGDFTLPDWEKISAWLEAQKFAESELNEAYHRLAGHWLERLQGELGGKYRVVVSENFHLLTELNDDLAKAALQILEHTRRDILTEWDGVASDVGYGPHVAIIFDEVDDYYDYVGQYFPDVEGEFAGSVGMMLNSGYVHIAIAQSDLNLCSSVLFHEMTHMLVEHLQLPLWVNEGLAMAAERALSKDGSPLLDEDMVRRHHAYWNEDTIQFFWNGESFSNPGDAQELSYNLAEILATQLRTIPGYRNFILNASWEDAGESAAREHLGAGVGDVAAIFLGDGPWGVDWE